MRTNRVRRAAVILAATLVLTASACGAKKDTKQQDAYRQYGITCMENGEYDNALKAFQNALDQSLGKVGDKEIDICFYKAKTQLLSGDTKGAMETYNAVIKYNKDPRAYYLRGSLSFEQGDTDKACADFDEAVNRDPKNYDLYIGIYRTMEEHGMESDGQKYLNRALEIKGEKPKDQLYKGRIRYLLGDSRNAVTLLQKAKDGKEQMASYYLALAYEDLGEDGKAKTCIREYLESGTATSYDLYELGESEMEDGDYKEALTYFNKALSLEEVPNRQSLMRSAIAAYEYSGDFASAKKMMKEYLEQYPSDEDAQRENTFLETRS